MFYVVVFLGFFSLFFLSFFMFGHSLISIKRGLSMFKSLRNFCERFLFSKTKIQYSLYRKNMQTKVWFWILGEL